MKMRRSFAPARDASLSRPDRLRSSVDESEDVVEHEVASLAVGQKLEGLGVAHRSLLLINL